MGGPGRSRGRGVEFDIFFSFFDRLSSFLSLFLRALHCKKAILPFSGGGDTIMINPLVYSKFYIWCRSLSSIIRGFLVAVFYNKII